VCGWRIHRFEKTKHHTPWFGYDWKKEILAVKRVDTHMAALPERAVDRPAGASEAVPFDVTVHRDAWTRESELEAGGRRMG
jgi:hypothetical protein